MKKPLLLILCLSLMLPLSMVTYGASPEIVTKQDDALILNVTNQEVLDKYFVWDSSGCSHKVEDGVWKITLDGSTWWAIADVTNQLHFNLADYPVYGIRYKAEGLSQPQVIFYDYTAESEKSGVHQAEIRFANLKNDGAWHTAIVNMDGNAAMSGEMSSYRFDVLDISGGTRGTMSIEKVIFAKTKAACEALLGEDTPIDPNKEWGREESIVKTDDVIAYRMGSRYMIDEYFAWSPANCTASVQDKLWRIDLNSNIAIADLSNMVRVDLDKYVFMAVRYKTEGMESGAIQFYSWTDVRESTGEERVDIPMICDGEWHIGMLDNRDNPYMEDRLNLLRVDIANNAGSSGTVYIDYILFAAGEDAARAFDEDGEFPAETFAPDSSSEDTVSPPDTGEEDTVQTTASETDAPAGTDTASEAAVSGTGDVTETGKPSAGEGGRTGLIVGLAAGAAAVLAAAVILIKKTGKKK